METPGNGRFSKKTRRPPQPNSSVSRELLHPLAHKAYSLRNLRPIILFLSISTSAFAQVLTVTRQDSAYIPNKKLTPTGIIDGNFDAISKRQYVIVEGYINYIAQFPTAETDGDFHFEMQSAKNIRVTGPKDPNGFVCEIDPVLQLTGLQALTQIKRNDPNTFRKVRVYGWLRFGTEATHSGVRPYSVNGHVFKGHFEIHPVEKIEAVDNPSSFKMGPTANYVAPKMVIRYKLDDSEFTGVSATNYAHLRGNVKTISGPNGSGDYDVRLEVNSANYLATIPQYYVQSFSPTTRTLSFVHSPNFASIHYSLKPSGTTQRTFYGLRNWTFGTGKPVPALQPVEMIK
jgi:hypothetical protein